MFPPPPFFSRTGHKQPSQDVMATGRVSWQWSLTAVVMHAVVTFNIWANCFYVNRTVSREYVLAENHEETSYLL